MATYNSDQLKITYDEPGSFVDSSEHGARLRILHWSFTNDTGAALPAGDILIAKLPAGRMRVLTGIGGFNNTALGTGRTLALGYTAHTDKNGDAVAEDLDAFKTVTSVATAATALVALNAADNGSWFFNAREGVDVVATIAGGDIPNGARVGGYLVYAKD